MSRHCEDQLVHSLRETIAVHSENHPKPINALCGKKCRVTGKYESLETSKYMLFVPSFMKIVLVVPTILIYVIQNFQCFNDKSRSVIPSISVLKKS
jgi:hypothetical protein